MAQYHTGPLVNANDVSPAIPLSGDRVTVVAIQTDHTNPAGAVLQLMGTFQPGVNPTFLQMACSDPTATAGTVVNTFTGPDKAGVLQFNASGLESVQVLRTDANGGNAGATVSVTQS